MTENDPAVPPMSAWHATGQHLLDLHRTNDADLADYAQTMQADPILAAFAQLTPHDAAALLLDAEPEFEEDPTIPFGIPGMSPRHPTCWYGNAQGKLAFQFGVRDAAAFYDREPFIAPFLRGAWPLLGGGHAIAAVAEALRLCNVWEEL